MTLQRNHIYIGDNREVLKTLPDKSVHCIITSPPYLGLRDYGVAGQIGLERSLKAYIDALVEVFRECRRVLRDDGALWINLGDSFAGGKGQSGSQGAEHQQERNKNQRSLNHGYQTLGGKKQTKPTDDRAMLREAGLKPKDMMFIPHRVAIALQEDGWYARMDIVWEKGSCMPNSVTDRPTHSHEYLFLFAKSGDTQFWMHPTLGGVRTKPAPDYYWKHPDGRVSDIEPPNWKREGWKRRNRWVGHNYFYDKEAIAEPVKKDSSERAKRAVSSSHKNLSVPGQNTHSMHKARANGEGYAMPTKRNKRSVWRINPKGFKGAHHATFPVALVEPPILASCPETTCAACGAPYVRVVQREAVIEKGHGTPHKQRQLSETSPNRGKTGGQYEHGSVGYSLVTAQEFKPSCTCGTAETLPGIVLDPFFGAGTTGLTAKRLNRDWIGIELNPDYAELAQKRIANDDPAQPKELAPGVMQLSLLGNAE